MKRRARRTKKGSSLGPLLPRRKSERRRVEFLGGVVLTLFALLIGAVFFASSLQRIALRSSNVAAVVSAVLIDLANQDRTSNGLSSLTMNPTLVEAAQAKANDMATYGYFAHISPQGVDPWHWFQQAGYKFVYAGENLAVDFSDSGDVNNAWMNSPTHRENILDPHYTEIGIATAQGIYQGRPTIFVVQEFGAPAVAKAQAPVQTASVPASPTTIAVASTKPPASPDTSGAQVLGSAAQSAPAVAPHPKPAAIATTSPALAASLAKSTAGNQPFWAFLVGFPRDTMRYAYYFIGALILLALAVDTELEFRWHHRVRAMRAGALLAVMGILFLLANVLFFAEPTLAAGISMAL